MTLANLSFRDDGTTGASGLGGTWTAKISDSRWAPAAAEGVFFAAFLLLGIVTLRGRIGSRKKLLGPVVWIAAFLGPTLLIRNVQMYYMYEAVAGSAVLLGMLLERASRRLIAA